MRITNLSSLPERQIQSPKARYNLRRKSVSEALGGIRDTGTWGGGHPFDLEHVALPPGATNFPFHSHAAQWEMYVFLSGSGQVRGSDGTAPVTAGDHVLFKPGEAHQIINTGETELTYYVIADNPPAEVVTYPDMPGKWAIKPARKIFTMIETDYYTPED